MNEVGELWWELEQHRQLRGACSCGDSTILGVIHSDTKPCSLPTVHMPLEDSRIWEIWFTTKGNQSDFAREIEKAHGIRGIKKL